MPRRGRVLGPFYQKSRQLTSIGQPYLAVSCFLKASNAAPSALVNLPREPGCRCFHLYLRKNVLTAWTSALHPCLASSTATNDCCVSPHHRDRVFANKNLARYHRRRTSHNFLSWQSQMVIVGSIRQLEVMRSAISSK